MVYNLLGLGGFKGGRYKSALAPVYSLTKTARSLEDKWFHENGCKARAIVRNRPVLTKSNKPQSTNGRIRLTNDTQNTKGTTEMKKVLTSRLIKEMSLVTVAAPLICMHPS